MACNVGSGYIMRFVRTDGKKDEVEYFWDRESAMAYMNSFRKDTSGLYKKIEVMSENGIVHARVAFYEGKEVPCSLQPVMSHRRF